jgi:hypothetical protein
VIRARRNDLDFFLARVEPQLALSDRDDRARLEVRLADPHLVDERTVGRPLIQEDIAIVLLRDPAMIARHRIVAEHDVVVVHRSDPDLLLVEYPLLRRIIDRLQDAPPEVQRRTAVEVADFGRRNEVWKLLHELRRHHIISPNPPGVPAGRGGS